MDRCAFCNLFNSGLSRFLVRRGRLVLCNIMFSELRQAVAQHTGHANLFWRILARGRLHLGISPGQIKKSLHQKRPLRHIKESNQSDWQFDRSVFRKVLKNPRTLTVAHKKPPRICPEMQSQGMLSPAAWRRVEKPPIAAIGPQAVTSASSNFHRLLKGRASCNGRISRGNRGQVNGRVRRIRCTNDIHPPHIWLVLLAGFSGKTLNDNIQSISFCPQTWHGLSSINLDVEIQ